MPQASILLTCPNCSRQVREAGAKEAGWRCWSDGVGELHPFLSDLRSPRVPIRRPKPRTMLQTTTEQGAAALAGSGLVGRVYLERGQPVTVVARWGSGGGPRNVLILRADGSRVTRPFRGLRRPAR